MSEEIVIQAKELDRSAELDKEVKAEDSAITSQKMQELEKLVLPFFTKLLKTADKEYIYWPNRTSAVEAQIQKILTITRG